MGHVCNGPGQNAYPYWFVTKGKDEHSVGRHGLVPLVLAPKATSTLRRLAELARAQIEHVAMTLLPVQASAMERLKAVAGHYAIAAFSDVWLTEVRTAAVDDRDPNEVSIEWIFALSGRLLADWQGHASGVIDKHEPVTIRLADQPPSRFRIIDE